MTSITRVSTLRRVIVTSRLAPRAVSYSKISAAMRVRSKAGLRAKPRLNVPAAVGVTGRPPARAAERPCAWTSRMEPGVGGDGQQLRDAAHWWCCTDRRQDGVEGGDCPGAAAPRTKGRFLILGADRLVPWDQNWAKVGTTTNTAGDSALP